VRTRVVAAVDLSVELNRGTEGEVVRGESRHVPEKRASCREGHVGACAVQECILRRRVTAPPTQVLSEVRRALWEGAVVGAC